MQNHVIVFRAFHSHRLGLQVCMTPHSCLYHHNLGVKRRMNNYQVKRLFFYSDVCTRNDSEVGTRFISQAFILLILWCNILLLCVNPTSSKLCQSLDSQHISSVPVSLHYFVPWRNLV
jgi:hypothetical protein